jgi:redox-sensitive bicupin YhaK (pirin superfamily)
MNSTATVDHPKWSGERLGPVVQGLPQEIGTGFTATHFLEDMFAGAMDPLLMVDHFVMKGPTFSPHLHAGISAVTAMFEDSVGEFLNRDTLGHTLALKAGDLYWLAAASGAAHEEKPARGAHVHALQIFVNLPGRLKKEPARALHVKAGDVPTIESTNSRVRVVLGSVGDVFSATDTPEEMTMLDGALQKGASFTHRLPSERQAWIYAVAGSITVKSGDEERSLRAGTATTVNAGDDIDMVISAATFGHFVVMAGPPIREPFVKAGPLVMCTREDVQRTLSDYAHGKYGRIPEEL